MSARTHQFPRSVLIAVAKEMHGHMANTARALDPRSIHGTKAQHDADAMSQIVAALEAYPTTVANAAELAVNFIFDELEKHKGFEGWDVAGTRKHLVAKLSEHVAGPTYPFGEPEQPAAPKPQQQPSDLDFV